MANKYALSPTKIITAPNGTKIPIYAEGDNFFVKVISLYRALGYAGRDTYNSSFGLVFKNHCFTLFKKNNVGSFKT